MSAEIYTRQSIEKKDSESIEVQIEYAKKFLDPDEPYEIFSDPGYSGKNTLRPDFQRMLKGIESGKFDKVIVYKLDRISRRVSDFSWLMEILNKHGCSFISAKENFSLDTPAGRAMLYMTSTFAQMERESTSERVKDSYYERLRLGAVGGGPAPFGYDNSTVILDGKKHSVYVKNPDADIVREMFDIYKNPLTTLSDVQKFLKNNYNIKAQTSDISRRLHNPAYVMADISVYNFYYKSGAKIASPMESFDGVHGCLLAGKRKSNERKYTNVKDHTLTVGRHEGIIDSRTFLYCQEKLSKNRQIKNTYKGQYTWLSGLVKCGECGYAMVVKRYRRKDGYVANFYCSNQTGHKDCCPHTHLVSDVEDYVYNSMLERAYSIEKAKKENEANTTEKLAEIYGKLKDINSRIENLVLSIENASKISIGYINKRIEELDAHRGKLEAQLGAWNYEASMLTVPNLNNWEEKSMDEKKNVARTMVEKVIISKSGLIAVDWRM